MTTTREPAPHHPTFRGKLSMAEVLALFTATGRQPLKFTAYDGSTAGNEDAALGLDLCSPRGATYLATAPGELGIARAYISGDLQTYGVHPGDPYELLKSLADRVRFQAAVGARDGPRRALDRHRAFGADRAAAARDTAALAPGRRRLAAQQDS